MKAQRYRSLGLAVLSSALVLLSGSNNVAATSSSAGSPSLDCTEASTADGDCDLSNNTEECGYDGGDCCECTCVDTTEYVCGVRAGFSCLDPSASCFVEAAEQTPTPSSTGTSAEGTGTGAPTTNSSCIAGALSDGSCDADNNNEECGYDGGDCCECTCISTTDNRCGAVTDFACVDPSASASCSANGEGDDDAIILLPATDDSTEQTSSPTSASTSQPTEEDLTATPAEGDSNTASSSCLADSLSDGHCDADNNNEECGFDYGDCCECTCVSTTEFTCGDFDCVDPSSACEELSIESQNSAYRTAQTSSLVYLQLAMFGFVLSVRRLSSQ